MKAAAHNPKFAQKAGIPVKVAKEFVREDKEPEMKARVYTEGMGQPPMDIDGGSAPKPTKSKQKPKKYAQGGMVGTKSRGNGAARSKTCKVY